MQRPDTKHFKVGTPGYPTASAYYTVGFPKTHVMFIVASGATNNPATGYNTPVLNISYTDEQLLALIEMLGAVYAARTGGEETELIHREDGGRFHVIR